MRFINKGPLPQDFDDAAPLKDGYHEMAEDYDHEHEAQEWIEALIGDGWELQIPRG